jgi:formylglycine-generating enzyme required for sulfatase activity
MTSKFALVIANTEYQDASFAKLSAPGKDAEEFAQVLREPELAAFEGVQVLLNEGEGKTRRAIARFFADRKRDDLLLLYFSGHGIRNGQGQLFLAANDTEISILEATGIPADFITYAMNNSRSQRQLLILDCCNSGAFAHGSKSASAVGKSMGIATAFEGSGFGRVVLTATDATQFAWEGNKVIGDTQKSVFTHFLIEGLKGNADRDGDGRIHVDELYDYAYEQVVRRTPKQTPGKWSYKQQGDIVLRENLKPRDVKPAALASDLLDVLAHPSSFVRSSGVQELIRLLDGKHLGLARTAQEKLQEIAENDDSLSLRKTASDTLMARGLVLEQAKPVSIEVPEKEQEVERKIKKAITTRRKEPISAQEIASSDKAVITGKLAGMKNFVPGLNLRFVAGVIGALLIVSFLVWNGSKLLINPPLTPQTTNSSNPTESITSQSHETPVSQSLKTNTPAQTQTSIPLTQTLVSPTSILGIGSTMAGKDGMTLLYVPAGEFTMGSDNGEADEKPVHTVYLDAFWIDKTEVTNAMYEKCVNANICKAPTKSSSFTHSSYYSNSNYDNYPVIYVDWDMATIYCEWAERRLPTEAQWEKAARGTDAREYPWGNDPPNNGLVNYHKSVGDTAQVGSYTDGASPYGALDMAGNVWEWVRDYYLAHFYNFNFPGEDYSNPYNDSWGAQAHVLRGGSWSSDDGGT